MFYDLCFGRRGAVELYDCKTDPEQVHNLADKTEHADVVSDLREQLVAYLKNTSDPRFTDRPVLFDDIPFKTD